jgi:hypothetical protein
VPTNELKARLQADAQDPFNVSFCYAFLFENPASVSRSNPARPCCSPVSHPLYQCLERVTYAVEWTRELQRTQRAEAAEADAARSACHA